MNDRRRLRTTTLARRDDLPEKELQDKSLLIRERLLAMEEIGRAAIIMVYVNYRSEVVSQPLIADLQSQGVMVAAPVTDPGDFRLIPYVIKNAAEDLVPGYCTIPEPDPEKGERLDPGQLDIVLVPGSVFDWNGGRLGYGAGYYDRFLSREAPQALVIGLAFELQIVDRVPLEDHDVPLDWVVTEERLIKGRGK